ncbi:protein NRT1/ PTR FAMILY 5.4-like [Apium graveolens]|uniref:protein NRT1/ PTR FAMILY 5.4-like n=1 Tax=Apium graveolens TaxID=4045 RepID=UPI003D79357E
MKAGTGDLGCLLCSSNRNLVPVHGKITLQEQCPKRKPTQSNNAGVHHFVFVAAIRNCNLSLPENAVGFHEVHDKQSETLHRTNQFRFLDHTAVIVTTDSSTVNNPAPWKMCTVTQVEETKILIRMLSIILSTIFMNTCLAQLQTFSIQQSNTMDRNLLGFQVPGSSIPGIPLVFMFILIPIYDRVCVPILRKFKGIPTRVTHLQRIGVGLVLSAISMAVAGIVETHRKSVAIEYNMVDSAEPLPMTSIWVSSRGSQKELDEAKMRFAAAEFWNGKMAVGMFLDDSCLGFGHLIETGDS